MPKSPTDVRIEKAEFADLDRVAPLFDAYRVFYEQNTDLPRARSFIEQRLRQQDSVIYLALGEQGEALGFTQLYATFSSVSTQSLWILNDLFVVPGTRKSGVGRALIARAQRLARETGAIGLSLATARDNHTAQSLYEAIGFKRDEKFYHYFLSVDVQVD